MYRSDYWRPSELKSSSALSWIFADINEELSRRGLLGDIYLMGDAAMLFPYDVRSIDYVEAMLAPKAELLEITRIISANTRLEENWLRDSNTTDVQSWAFNPAMQCDHLTIWHPGGT